MSNRATVNQWLRELSPAGATFALDELGVCALADDDGVVVRIEVPEESGRVYLASHLEPWQEHGQSELLVTLMKANFLGLETNGAAFAIDERSARFVLGVSEAVAHLNRQTFETMVGRFFDVRKQWGARLKDARWEQSGGEIGSWSGDAPEAVMIRV